MAEKFFIHYSTTQIMLSLWHKDVSQTPTRHTACLVPTNWNLAYERLMGKLVWFSANYCRVLGHYVDVFIQIAKHTLLLLLRYIVPPCDRTVEGLASGFLKCVKAQLSLSWKKCLIFIWRGTEQQNYFSCLFLAPYFPFLSKMQT